MASDKYADTKLRDKVKKDVQNSADGGEPGQWSGRKGQVMNEEYKKRGGKFKDSASNTKSNTNDNEHSVAKSDNDDDPRNDHDGSDSVKNSEEREGNDQGNGKSTKSEAIKRKIQATSKNADASLKGSGPDARRKQGKAGAARREAKTQNQDNDDARSAEENAEDEELFVPDDSQRDDNNEVVENDKRVTNPATEQAAHKHDASKQSSSSNGSKKSEEIKGKIDDSAKNANPSLKGSSKDARQKQGRYGAAKAAARREAERSGGDIDQAMKDFDEAHAESPGSVEVPAEDATKSNEDHSPRAQSEEQQKSRQARSTGRAGAPKGTSAQARKQQGKAGAQKRAENERIAREGSDDERMESADVAGSDSNSDNGTAENRHDSVSPSRGVKRGHSDEVEKTTTLKKQKSNDGEVMETK